MSVCACVCVCVCVCVNDIFCVCGVRVVKLVCACDSVLFVPCLWGGGGMSMLSYFVSAYVCAI